MKARAPFASFSKSHSDGGGAHEFAKWVERTFCHPLQLMLD